MHVCVCCMWFPAVHCIFHLLFPLSVLPHLMAGDHDFSTPDEKKAPKRRLTLSKAFKMLSTNAYSLAGELFKNAHAHTHAILILR